MSEDEGTTFIDTSSRDKRPDPVTPDKTAKKRDGLYILIILLLLGGIGYMAYSLSDKNKQISDCDNEKTALENEMADLNE
jgi:hypothetical protein